jgi:hypothetical protein
LLLFSLELVWTFNYSRPFSSSGFEVNGIGGMTPASGLILPVRSFSSALSVDFEAYHQTTGRGWQFKYFEAAQAAGS